jgi:hypothetical protein
MFHEACGLLHSRHRGCETNRTMKKLLCLLFVAACGGGGNDKPDVDAPVAPGTVTISGTASSRGLGGATPEAGVTIAAFSTTDENTPLATSTTDAAGAFTLTITTTGTAINGFLKATKSGFTTSYLYPPTAITGDLMMVPMNMLTTGNFGTLSTLAQANQQTGKGVVAMLVLSGPELTSMAVAGATISTSPASMPYRYNGGTGLPNTTAAVTAADGIAYAFNAPTGAMTVTASKSGTTFKPTMLSVHADALTQTIVTP